MILTDKCLKDFLEYIKNYCCEYEESKRGVFLWFGNETDLLHKDCKLFLNALIIEFFDSVGIYIGIDPLYDMQGTFRAYVDKYGFQSISRQEATEKAIIKANDIYNETKI